MASRNSVLHRAISLGSCDMFSYRHSRYSKTISGITRDGSISTRTSYDQPWWYCMSRKISSRKGCDSIHESGTRSDPCHSHVFPISSSFHPTESAPDELRTIRRQYKTDESGRYPRRLESLIIRQTVRGQGCLSHETILGGFGGLPKQHGKI